MAHGCPFTNHGAMRLSSEYTGEMLRGLALTGGYESDDGVYCCGIYMSIHECNNRPCCRPRAQNAQRSGAFFQLRRNMIERFKMKSNKMDG